MSYLRKKIDGTYIGTQIISADITRLLCLVAFVLYACVILLGVLHHEPWRDEAQAWLLTRDLDLVDLLKKLPSEGHPPLWYLLIMPLAKLGLPYVSQNWLAGGIMIVSVYILLFKTPFKLPVRLLLPFSYFFLFEYTLLARNYCLLVLFVLCIVHYYPYRFQKPWTYGLLLIGLCNTHVLVFSFCIGLLGLYMFDAVRTGQLNKNVLGASLVACVGCLYILPYMAAARMTAVYTNDVYAPLLQLQRAVGGAMGTGDERVSWVLMSLLVTPLFTRPRIFVVLMIGLGGLLYILAYKYAGALRHQGIILLQIICAHGLAHYNERSPGMVAERYRAYGQWLLLLPVLLQLQPGVRSYADDNQHSYSGAKDVARFIIDNNLQDALIIGHQAWAASAVLPYLNKTKRFYYPEAQGYGSFYNYGNWYAKKIWTYPVDYAVNETYGNFKDSLDNVVLLFNHPVSPQAGKYLDLVYTSEGSVIRFDERFYIYRFKSNVR